MKSYCLFASEIPTIEHKAIKASDGKTLWIRITAVDGDLNKALDLAGDDMRTHETLLNTIPESFGT